MAKVLDPLSDSEVNKMTVVNLKTAYKKLADFCRKILNGNLVYCSHCGQWRTRMAFYSSDVSADHLEHYACKECILDECTDYDKKTGIRTDNREKTIETFKRLNWYFDEGIYNDQLQSLSEQTGEKVRTVVSSILRPMNATPRQPGYMNNPKYSGLAEMPKEVYLTSAWYSMSELYEQAKSYAANMLDPNLSYFVADLPYQVSIREGLLMRQQILNEMTESTFSDIIFMMEREGKFYGSAADALFDYKILNERRILQDCLYPLEYYRVNSVKIPEKKKDEIRILSVDIALMGSKKHDNDATCITIHSAVPTSSNDYIDNIVYVESQEGLLAEDLGLLILREFYQYDCDYIAIDGSGVGQPIVDYLIYSDRYDPVYNVTYPCLNCINNTEISDRCKVKTAKKVIYVIKANAKSNNDMYLALRAGFQNGYINMLLSDINIEEHLAKIRGYSKLSAQQKALLLLPYLQTTFMINELINLQCDSSGVLIKVKERTGMRKDRVSSCMYGYNVCQMLAAKRKPKNSIPSSNLVDMLPIQTAKTFSYFD